MEGRDELDLRRHGMFCAFGAFYLVRRDRHPAIWRARGAGARGGADCGVYPRPS